MEFSRQEDSSNNPSEGIDWPWNEVCEPPADTMPDGSRWPKISVVTPSYNQCPFLEETLRSVLLQGYPNLEYLVIDGGSTDGSVELIERYAPDLTYWVSEPDRGQSHAINKGFARATGDILCWINSDDFLQPGALQFVAQMLPRSPEPAWMIGASHIIDADSNLLWSQTPQEVTYEHLFRWVDKHWFPQQSTFWTRQMWNCAGPLDEHLQYAMDVALWFAMFSYEQPIMTQKVLSGYRFHDDAKTLANIFQSKGEVLEVFKQYVKQPSPARLKPISQAARRKWVAEEVMYWAYESSQAQRQDIALRFLLTALAMHPFEAFSQKEMKEILFNMTTTMMHTSIRQSKHFIKQLIKQLPGIQRIVRQRDLLQQQTEELQKKLSALQQACGYMPPGHFYSPIPAIEEIQAYEDKIFGDVPRTLPGIALREEQQLRLFEQLAVYYRDLPFQASPQENLRYFFENPGYSYSDAICLYGMLRHLQPQRLIEVGSGYSSCVTLDTNDLYLEGNLQLTFIEPFPERFLSLSKDGDSDNITLIPKRLQDVDLELFGSLQANDVLFVDSTHVGKIGSDVLYMFSSILPHLTSGVHIHFHDIFYPFEYPKEWIYRERIAWNEAYLLRAFLQYNESFEIIFLNTFLEHFHPTLFEERMPLCLKDPGGSIWIRKK